MATHVQSAPSRARRRDTHDGTSGPAARAVVRAASLLAVVAGALAASGSSRCRGRVPPAPTSHDDAEVRILFVGNSLTYVNDLPGMVASIATLAGRSVSTVTIASPDYALEDHWASGVAGGIRRLKPTVVVMQQGPSSLSDSRANLVQWTDSLARVAREAGATPALLMVWPELARFDAFDAVRDSYRAAAEHVDGVFIPAGEAFRALHEQHPEMEPYGSDAFHPSHLGSVVSALVVVRAVLGDSVSRLASVLAAGSARPSIVLTAEQARVLTGLADSVGAAWAGTPSSRNEPVRVGVVVGYAPDGAFGRPRPAGCSDSRGRGCRDRISA